MPFVFAPSVLADVASDAAAREAEWRRVFQHFDPRLRSYFRLRVLDEDQLDVLLGEIWRRAVLKIGGLRSCGAAWSWLTRIGINLLRDWGRRAASERRRTRRVAALADADREAWILGRVVDEPTAAATAITPDMVDRAIGRLDVNEQLLFRLWVVDELSHEELAAHAGVGTAATSRQRMKRIRDKLLGWLRADGEN
ncbi:MAG: sigma-70 family RNA polymerase sigma factor, partial [Gemmatimonadota bacterium]|nr:sigma-70 family RNA polymerase sigma factor [Gemmatimonadota bacterium]